MNAFNLDNAGGKSFESGAAAVAFPPLVALVAPAELVAEEEK